MKHRPKAPLCRGRLTPRRFLRMELKRAGHAAAPTNKIGGASRPSSVMAYAMPPSPRGRLTLRRFLCMKFVRIGACRRPYTQNRKCVPPLIRPLRGHLPPGEGESPKGRHPYLQGRAFFVPPPPLSLPFTFPPFPGIMIPEPPFFYGKSVIP